MPNDQKLREGEVEEPLNAGTATSTALKEGETEEPIHRGTPPSMGATKPMTDAQRLHYQMVTGEEPPGRLQTYLEEGANYTPEGRREHPIRAFVGDTTKKLEDFGRLASIMAPLMVGPEGAGVRPERPARVPVWKGAPAVEAPAAAAAPERLQPIPRNWSGREMPLPGRAETPAAAPAERLQPAIEPMQKKPLGERRLGEAGRKPTIDSVVNQATGVKPLEPNKPLREQLSKAAATAEPPVDPIKAKYPDPEIRQLVRANGEEIYEAAKGSPERLKAIHDLTRVDLRQALINAGEDMGQVTVSNSKFAGKGSITREEAFHRLLGRGKSPDEIVELAKPRPAVAELKPGETTQARYYDPVRKEWAPERAANHQAFAEAATAGKAAPTDRPPEAIITLGGTASGKTTMARHFLGEDANRVNIDADTAKLSVPEYANLKKTDPQNAAARVHEESSAIAKRTVQQAVSKGLDFIYDTSTGGGGEPLLQKLKQLGYRVKVYYADIPVEEALGRAKQRALTSTDPTNRGRFVPEDVIRENHQKAAEAFQNLRNSKSVDEIHGVDTSSRTPVKFYSRVDGEHEQIIGRRQLEASEAKAKSKPPAAKDQSLVFSER